VESCSSRYQPRKSKLGWSRIRAASSNVYFIDNDFDGARCAGELARKIRVAHPNVLVIAFSATLDQDTLKELIHGGCDGVCDKSVPEDLPVAMNIVEEYVRALDSSGEGRKQKKGFLGAVHSIAQLLREWNSRLETQEQALKP
jgi:DNA-binding NarL/FixJ family response regulator